MIFREALKAEAEKIAIAHNHPTGNMTPSKADIALTARLSEAGERLSVPLTATLSLEGCASEH